MVLALNLGFPRIGVKRELKAATEQYWKGAISERELIETGRALRLAHWTLQKEAGINFVPVNDFSFYDHMLDMSCLLGVVPSRYGWSGNMVDIDTYFAMARGRQDGKTDVTAMEMTKWFDTNYHYIVPELKKGQEFKISSSKLFDETEEAKQAGFDPVPVVIGPLTYLLLSKKEEGFTDCRCTLVPGLAAAYADICKKLLTKGVQWIHFDEPCLATDLEDRYKKACASAYEMIKAACPDMNIVMTSYFGGLKDNLDLAFSLPVAAVQVDLVRAPDQLEVCALKAKDTGKGLILGLVDGRNIWANNLSRSMDMIEKAKGILPEGYMHVSGSCSLLHCPIDLDFETSLDREVKSWMAFAKQKLAEICILAKGAEQGRSAIAAELRKSDEIITARQSSKRVNNPSVKERMKAFTPEMAKRNSPFAKRRTIQQAELGLPAFPTTTIGSFPQTEDIRKARAALKRGDITQEAYDKAMTDEIKRVVDYQVGVDIDVLVHGEPERNDMVEYFGEQLEGFVFTKQGWVQSYGSRCVKPPVIFGDVSRPTPMTVKWAKIAQSMTTKLMKGMLTGPITILQWSFVRDDQPRSETAKQIAFAIRDEVVDLEKAGIKVIQIDEPAVREGLPLRKSDWANYLQWAVEAFRISASGVADKTQIHTHMCYCEFNDIIHSIADLDADVISIETSRSAMELLDAFVAFKYPNEIGPGVYDIHSPRIPSKEEMVKLLEKAATVLSPDQIWVNPDCGLKTRGWKEVEPALKNMVEAAKELRKKAGSAKAA